MAILRCRVLTNALNVKQYVPFALEDDKKATPINDGVVAFNVFPGGVKIDMREKAPYHQILPCPYCGTDNDRKHDPSKHVDPRLGISIAESQALADESGMSELEAYFRLWKYRK